MTGDLRFPLEDVSGTSADFNPAADFLEFSAFFASNLAAHTLQLSKQFELGSMSGHETLDDEMRSGHQEIVSSTIIQIEERQRCLGSSAYPFDLDARGDILKCNLNQGSLGHTAYILSLVLSNLKSLSPILAGSCLHPDNEEEGELRKFFQYFATAALASEIQGSAWSFGFPRLDGSGFVDKLRDIWEELGDGSVQPQPGAPQSPKDDQIDIFAARTHPDQLPGFPLVAAQVATGQDMRSKSLKGHIDAFRKRWFASQPATDFVVYMVVPFAVGRDQFVDHVRVVGNLLHRLRMPRRVAEAEHLVKSGETVEGYDVLKKAAKWVMDYQERGKA